MIVVMRLQNEDLTVTSPKLECFPLYFQCGWLLVKRRTNSRKGHVTGIMSLLSVEEIVFCSVILGAVNIPRTFVSHNGSIRYIYSI